MALIWTTFFAIFLIMCYSVDSASVMKREIQNDDPTVTETQTWSLLDDQTVAETQTSPEAQTSPEIQTTAETTAKPVKYCRSLVCGWQKFTPFTREIEYYFKNTCECYEYQYCIRVAENVSNSTYEYKCRDIPSTTTTTQPPTTPQ